MKLIFDGDPGEWKEYAFSDGTWDLYRVQASSWYDEKSNRLTDHGNEPSPEKDLSSRYFLSWTNDYLVFGGEIIDNRNDVEEKNHTAKRWYYKDAVAIFVECPADTINEKFSEGDHAFAFIADSTYPSYGAWWRHGTKNSSYIEEPIPTGEYKFKLKFNSHEESKGNFSFEAGIKWEKIFRQPDTSFQVPRIDMKIRIMIVHCDPDGGEYGGHLLIYGKNDEDNSWSPAVLGGIKTRVERKIK